VFSAFAGRPFHQLTTLYQIMVIAALVQDKHIPIENALIPIFVF